MIVFTTAGGSPLRTSASHPRTICGDSTSLGAGARGCPLSEKVDPSSEEFAKEGLSRGTSVLGTTSDWASKAQPRGLAPRPPWPCTGSVREGSLGETHICVSPEASCMPVHLYRGSPRTGRKTTASETCPGRQASPKRLQFSWGTSGWSRHSPRRACWRESSSAARLSSPGTWTARSDLRCFWLQRRRWRASCDMRRERRPLWCTQRSQCCPSGPVYASRVAAFWSGAEQAILPATRGNWYATAAGALSRALRLRARCTWPPSPWQRRLLKQQHAWILALGELLPEESKVRPWAEGATAGRGEWDPVRAVAPCPSRDSVVKPTLKRSHMKQSERRDSGWGCHMPQEPLKMFQWNRPLALERGPGASGGTEQKFSTRPSSGGRSGAIAISWRAGSRGSGSPVPGTPPSLALHRLGRGGGGPRRFPVASSMLRPLWRLLLWPSWSGGGGRRRAPSATSRRRGCSRRWGWRQQRTAGAGCDETPPSASVRRRTVGQSPPPLRRIGRPGRSGSPGSGACRTPSYPPRSATGGAPGPLMWTSSDPGPAPWLSSPLARGPSLCAVPATHLGQHHPRAAVSTPWPGGPAGGPWRAGRKRPVQQHRKPWPLERTRTYRPWAEGVDYPSRRQRPAGKAAWQWRARLGGPPPTPGPLRRRGWWGRRRH